MKVRALRLPARSSIWPFSAAPGGGIASVGATALTATPTPSVTPSSGADTIRAENLRVAPTVVASDSYSF